MIYCGYQGCGKTTYCKEHSNCVDLDSSNVKKDKCWFIHYCETAKRLSESGQKVFISAHRQVIDYLLENEIKFEILAPAETKMAWRTRLELRYHQHQTLPNLKAIADFDQNYEKDMEWYKYCEEFLGIKVHWIKAKVRTNLEQEID